MTSQRKATKLVAGVVTLGLVVAACGGDDDDAAEEPAEATAEEPAEATAEEPAEATAEEPAEGGAIDLASVCPAEMVIQTDWWPEAEHGAMYQMIGDDYTVDADVKSTTGSLVAGGEPTGVSLEVRAGGPAIGFNPPRVNMYTDDSIQIGYTSTDAQAQQWADLPLISVMAPLEKNPQIVMWDPETYPDIETIADLGEAGVTVNLFGGAPGFPEAFVALGIWTEDMLDKSYDGTPARFIADGTIAQQGFASAEPYLYKNTFEEFGRDVAFELLHDAGYQVYSQSLGVKPDDLETLRPCLELLVPIVQQATVDYASDPARTNAMIVDVVEQFNSDWVYNDGVAAFASETMTELELHSNGPDSTVGNFDFERIDNLINTIRDAGAEVPADLTAEDMYTNEFIDESIGF